MPNVPPTNLIMEQSAHCDWDWQTTNEIYYDKGNTNWDSRPCAPSSTMA